MTEVQRWTDQRGQEWACVSEEHGDGCDRCLPIDDFRRQMVEQAEDGLVEIIDDLDRGWMFRLTAKGQARVESLIQSDPEALAIYVDAQRPAPEEGQDG